MTHQPKTPLEKLEELKDKMAQKLLDTRDPQSPSTKLPVTPAIIVLTKTANAAFSLGKLEGARECGCEKCLTSIEGEKKV